MALLKEYEGMNGIWKQIHPRKVIWYLLSIIGGGLIWIALGYAERIDAVEDWKNDQNGALREMSKDIKAVVEKMDEVYHEQKGMIREQAKLRTDVEVIKQRLEDQ